MDPTEAKSENPHSFEYLGERQYRQLFEYNPCPMWIVGEDTLAFLEVNDAAVHQYGFTPQEFLGMTLQDITAADSDYMSLDASVECKIGNRASRFYKHKKKDGTIFEVELVSDDVMWSSRKAQLTVALDITARRRAELALRQSQQLLQDISDNSTAVIHVKDLDGYYRLVNRRFCEIFHLDRKEVCGKTAYDLFPREVADVLRESDQRVIAAGHSLTEEQSAPFDDGQHTYLSVKSPLLDSSGKPYLLCSIATDITDRKRSEEALREAEQRFRLMADFTYDWEYWAGPDRKMIYVTPSCERLTGFSAEEFMQDPDLVVKIVHPEDQAALLAHFEESFESEHRIKEQRTVIDFRIIKRDGSTVWMNHTCRPVFGSDGRWLGRRISNRDITKRKESEHRIQRLSRLYATLSQVNQTIVRIKDRDSLFQTICRVTVEFGKLQLAWIGLVEADREQTRLVACSTSAGNWPEDSVKVNENTLFGYESMDMVVRSGKIMVYNDISSFPEKSIWREAALARGYHCAAIVPIYCKGKVVGTFNLYSSTRGYFTDEEEIALLEEIGLDISFALDAIETEEERQKTREEHSRLEEQLRQAQKMESVGRLAGGIAHDFNNLLGVIIGYSEYSLLFIPGEDPLRETILEVKKAAGRAAELTHQLLAFSRKQVIEPKVFNLNTIATDLSRMLERMIGEDIKLNMALMEGLGQIKADRGQIEQILMNLAVNARDAMPIGGSLVIETENVELDDAYARGHFTVAPGSYVMLAVSDSGVGMNEEVQNHIFEPFFTTKEQGKGTGLGLSTVYGIVKQNGGYIWVYSEIDKGTTFKIYFPRVSDGTEIETISEEGQSFEGTETILLVEDAEGIRKLTQQCLESKGYTILSSTDVPEALTFAKEHSDPIHLLLTDVVLPSAGGPELAKQFHLFHPEARVLYMSGYTDDAILHHGVLEPGVAFLQKPFAVDDLWRRVRNVLDSDESRSGKDVPDRK